MTSDATAGPAPRQPSKAAAPPAEPGPIGAGERVQLIDVLRGFALLGILVVNMQWHKSALGGVGLPPRYDGAVDQAAGWLISLAFESKFFVLFSFLFGYGLAVQMARAAAHGAPLVPRYLRRLAVLLLLGLGHALLLFTGDILVAYALLGLIPLAGRMAPDRALLGWAGGLVTGWALLLALFALGAAGDAAVREGGAVTPDAGTAAERQAETATARAEAERIEAERIEAGYRGTPGEIVAQRAGELPGVWASSIAAMAPTVVAMFLLGLWAGRIGLLARVRQHERLLRRARALGLLVGLPGAVLYTAAVRGSAGVPATALAGLAVGVLTAPFLSAVYATSIALAHERPAVARLLAPLAPVGRMALTNYLLQSVVCAFVFTGYGLGLYGQVGHAAGLALSVAIFACQVPLSALWLRHFRFGPVEWLLRSVTYLRPQPLRVEPSPVGPG
jgi:uncharacterized protein